jgi:hypothetical protein
MLLKSRRGKTPVKSDDKETWQFSPSKEEKRIQKIRERENMPPSQKMLDRIPLLKEWMERGKDFIEEWKIKDKGKGELLTHPSAMLV